jgi:threonine dehydratase
VGNRSVTEFNYRISEARLAHVFVGIQVANATEPARIAKNFRVHGFATLDLTHDEMSKTHLRHMVGGRSTLADNELLYRFEFPERPGALTRFLQSMKPDWNISLFHYRNQGAAYGQVLIGIQVPRGSKKAFKDFLDEVGYPYFNETDNPVYKLFL